MHSHQSSTGTLELERRAVLVFNSQTGPALDVCSRFTGHHVQSVDISGVMPRLGLVLLAMITPVACPHCTCSNVLMNMGALPDTDCLRPCYMSDGCKFEYDRCCTSHQVPDWWVSSPALCVYITHAACCLLIDLVVLSVPQKVLL